MNFKKHVLMGEADDGSLSGGGVGITPTPAAAPASPAIAAPAAPQVIQGTPAVLGAQAPVAPAPPPPAGYWPDDWRARIAKGDEKRLQRAARYASPEAAIEAGFEAQDRIYKGDVKPVLGANPTVEQLTEWRQAHGVPEAPDKYDVSDLGNGLKVSDRDKPLIDRVLAAAHMTNQTPDQIKSTLRAYYDVVDKTIAAQAEADRAHEVEGMSTLRSEWGGDYQVNSNLIANLLSGTAGKEFSEQLMSGRLPDGKLIKNSPAVQKFLLNLALVQNPIGALVPAGGNPAQGIKDELDKISKTMRDNRTAYNKDQAMQERFRTLTEAAINASLMDANGNWKT